MTYGFDNVKRLKPHLRYPGLKTEEIHRYVHQKTKLADFSFLLGVCLDIDDVERYVKDCIKNANPLVHISARQKLSYTVPQQYWFYLVRGSNWAPNEQERRLKGVFESRFGLTEDEIKLGRSFFNDS